MEERDNLISRFEAAQLLNVELRKSIRALERELYTMCHKNAHTACVIDGLQELDEEIKQTKYFKADLAHKLMMAGNEQSNCQEIISMLNHEISLLRTKNGADAGLITSLKPHNERLKDILDNEKLKNHQKAQEFRRELQTMLQQSSEKNVEYDALMSQNSSKISWLEETFFSIPERITESTSLLLTSDTEEEDVAKSKSKKPKAKKDAKPAEEEINEKLVLTKEINEYIANTDLVENENDIIRNLISDNLQKMSERFDHLIELSTSLYNIEYETSLVREYIERLNKVRLRQEVIAEKDSALIAEELDELNIILNTQTNEGEFLKNLLDQFWKRLKDDFLLNSIFLHKSKEQVLEILQL
ncbi:uncharacterized protein TNCT_684561 [Trichonephila clavata]|uniref:Uncharacterized protein n=1 Tax=Trichonephila clavata TaxID=2740835 RepID=A0A8X6HJH5_TRICU|nr:uncharacterized protein TNCT_684561 [Trichonephila clavata]